MTDAPRPTPDEPPTQAEFPPPTPDPLAPPPSEPYTQPAAVPRRRWFTPLFVAGALAVGLALALGGFAVGRGTAPASSPPAGPASVADALQMAKDNKLPCGTVANAQAQKVLERACQAQGAAATTPSTKQAGKAKKKMGSTTTAPGSTTSTSTP